jgi:DNA-directed RNA polymerase subunit H
LDKTVFAKHEVLGAEEAKGILEKYKASEDELPRIKKEDPALKDLTYKVGSIIKITRKSATAGQAVYYRVVVD